MLGPNGFGLQLESIFRNYVFWYNQTILSFSVKGDPNNTYTINRGSAYRCVNMTRFHTTPPMPICPPPPIDSHLSPPLHLKDYDVKIRQHLLGAQTNIYNHIIVEVVYGRGGEVDGGT
jgi:hypothetical protein